MKDRLFVLSGKSISPPAFGHQGLLSRGIGGITVAVISDVCRLPSRRRGNIAQIHKGVTGRGGSAFCLKAAHASIATMLKASTSTFPTIQ